RKGSPLGSRRSPRPRCPSCKLFLWRLASTASIIRDRLRRVPARQLHGGPFQGVASQLGGAVDHLADQSPHRRGAQNFPRGQALHAAAVASTPVPARYANATLPTKWNIAVNPLLKVEYPPPQAMGRGPICDRRDRPSDKAPYELLAVGD